MKTEEISHYVNHQLKNILLCDDDVSEFISESVQRTLYCYSMSKNKYYTDSKLSVYHSGKYSIFLYYLSNTIYKSSLNEELAAKVYYLNKILHSVDWFYAIDLPEYWGVEHPLSSVLGRAKYEDGFFVYQNCTVGGNKKKYPTIGKNVIMYSNSSILGDSIIGNNVVVSTGTIIKDEDIPDDSLVFGQSPNLLIKNSKERSKEIVEEIWNVTL